VSLRQDVIGMLLELNPNTLKIVVNECCRNVIDVQGNSIEQIYGDAIVAPSLSFNCPNVYIANAAVGEYSSYMVWHSLKCIFRNASPSKQVYHCYRYAKEQSQCLFMFFFPSFRFGPFI
jgi:hypothetical protein